jgi:formylglycine-generating enzyme required for sulfatase activity
MSEPYCDPIDPLLDALGWYCGNAGGMPHATGLRSANAWRLYDMHGNVFEWCWDYFHVYGPDIAIDPFGPSMPVTPMLRVIRSGMYNSYAGACRSSSRDGTPARVTGVIGFRVVRTY